jgi:hypothetical protein
MYTYNWISTLPEHLKNVPLNNIVIPWTHDSGAYQVVFNIKPQFNNSKHHKVLRRAFTLAQHSNKVKDFIKDWTVTQNRNIYQQLYNGVRGLDLRIAFINKKYYVSHGYICDTLENVLNDICRFLSDYPNEIIFISMANDHINESTMNLRRANELLRLFNSTFDDLLITRQTHFPSYNELMSKNTLIKNNNTTGFTNGFNNSTNGSTTGFTGSTNGSTNGFTTSFYPTCNNYSLLPKYNTGRIFLFYNAKYDKEKFDYVWSTKLLHNKWINTSILPDKISALEYEIAKFTKSNKDLNIVQYIFTAQVKDIIYNATERCFLISSYRSSIFQINLLLFQYLDKFLTDNMSDLHKISGFFLDFPTKTITKKIISLNFL